MRITDFLIVNFAPDMYENRQFFKRLIANPDRQFFKMRIVNIVTSFYDFVINFLLKICIFDSKVEIFFFTLKKNCTFKIPYFPQKILSVHV